MRSQRFWRQTLLAGAAEIREKNPRSTFVIANFPSTMRKPSRRTRRVLREARMIVRVYPATNQPGVRKALVLLHAEPDYFFYGDGGTLDIGIVRDPTRSSRAPMPWPAPATTSTLGATNDFKLFFEEFSSISSLGLVTDTLGEIPSCKPHVEGEFVQLDGGTLDVFMSRASSLSGNTRRPAGAPLRDVHVEGSQPAAGQRWWWLSFIDTTMPYTVEGDYPGGPRHQGVCIVAGADLMEAAANAWDRGCNPGGEAAGYLLHFVPHESFVNKLFVGADAYAMGRLEPEELADPNVQLGAGFTRVTLENCVCGECFYCPDGYHTDDDMPCLCTPDCILGTDLDDNEDDDPNG